MKGILAIANTPQKFVYQAVHMIFSGNFEGEWVRRLAPRRLSAAARSGSVWLGEACS
jgi:hypothetical protein